MGHSREKAADPYQEAILSQTPALKAAVLNQGQEALRQKELEQTASLFNQQLAQQAEQYNTSMAWQKRTAERDLALRTEQFLKSYEQARVNSRPLLHEQKAEREADLPNRWSNGINHSNRINPFSRRISRNRLGNIMNPLPRPRNSLINL